MPELLTRDDIKLYYKVWGAGRDVILLHGWPLSADSWDDHALALAQQGFRVIAYDRRGFGRSDQPWEGYDYDTLADDLADVIRATGATDAALVGFSMGGGEVARYLTRHEGARVGKAALVASVVPFMLRTRDNPEGVAPEVFQSMRDDMHQDRARFFTDFFKAFYGIGQVSKPVSKEMLDWSRSVAMQASLRATLACVEAFATTDFRPDLLSFDVPTLVIHGTDDATVPPSVSGRAAARGIRDAELKEYEGAPHGLFATHKHQLARDLLDFLRG